MKLDKFALICVVVVFGLWLLAVLVGAVSTGLPGLILLIPLLIVGYLVGGVIQQRLANKDDDYYDEVEK